MGGEGAESVCVDYAHLFVRGQALGIPIGMVADAETLLEDRQLGAGAFFRDIEHPAIGRFVDVGPAFTLDDWPGRGRRGPGLGEHTAELRAELGLDRVRRTTP